MNNLGVMAESKDYQLTQIYLNKALQVKKSKLDIYNAVIAVNFSSIFIKHENYSKAKLYATMAAKTLEPRVRPLSQFP